MGKGFAKVEVMRLGRIWIPEIHLSKSQDFAHLTIDQESTRSLLHGKRSRGSLRMASEHP